METHNNNTLDKTLDDSMEEEEVTTSTSKFDWPETKCSPATCPFQLEHWFNHEANSDHSCIKVNGGHGMSRWFVPEDLAYVKYDEIPAHVLIIQSSQCNTRLGWAVMENDTELIQKLVANGDSVHACSPRHCLFDALWENIEEWKSNDSEDYNVALELQDPQSESPIVLAAWAGNISTLRIFLQALSAPSAELIKSEELGRALLAACIHADLDMFRELVDVYHANVNHVHSSYGNNVSPLTFMHQIRRNLSGFCGTDEEIAACIQYLTEHGATCLCASDLHLPCN